MQFRKFINDVKNDKKKFISENEIPQEPEANTDHIPREDVANEIGSETNENARLFNMKDPDTGRRFDIPMLSRFSANYYYQYISYMKMKERQPDTFDKILNWD